MTDRPEHDVIVAGAGMAGCRAALTLAKHRLRVLLLDKQHFPRWKPCAGGITLKAKPYIPAELRPLLERTMRGAYLTWGNDYSTHIRSSGILGWMVHRESFDAAHLQLAASHPTVDLLTGVSIRDVSEEGTRVVLYTSSGQYRTRALIGADGVDSVVSRLLPGHERRSIGFAYEGEARLGEARLTEDALFDFRKFPQGYGWIFPKLDHYSIGGFVYDRHAPGIKGLYDEFCNETDLLMNCQTYRAKGHRIPHGGSYRKLNSSRIVLVGDAADLVDPMSGEGIYYALRSGHLAGEALAQLLSAGVPLDRYSEQVHTEIQRNLRYARFCADLLFNWPRLSFHLLFRNSLICRWFTQILSGEMDYRDLYSEVLKKALILPFHAGIARHRVVQVKVGDRTVER